MEETAIKDELIDIIEHADLNQLKEICGILTNYITKNESFNNWDSIPEPLKRKIEKSIEEGNADLVTPAKEAIKRAREKYSQNS